MTMTSRQTRQSFFDFFESKQHTIVKSASLMPDAPNLLFTNAGMNQFVPIFLGQTSCPYRPGRAADSQKCIRAGGKHNDLEDVGADTYHHTFFEMLGNWSFGDYFKQEAIDWAWELLVDVWGFPPERLYATYFGGDDTMDADVEARDLWLRHLPAERIVPGNRKDNFWMMGDTGPCGPCSELHIDLTPDGNGGAALVNAGTADSIEIWNLVFIQLNANPDGSYSPLPACHVDTGMGFERACSVIQCTQNFTDFSGIISNYETDVFTPIFRTLEALSGKKYGSAMTDPVDIAFRVIADHIRCLTFALADGIVPCNDGRGYVLRRILRRAVRTGRILGFKDPFFYKLADTVAELYGDVFPELRKNLTRVKKTLKAEEESFNRTLDRGIELFDQVASDLSDQIFPAAEAFKLYDTFGFPIDLTEVMARERGIQVDTEGFEKLMEQQRARARADYACKKSIIMADDGTIDGDPTCFTGYCEIEAKTTVIEVLESGAVLLEQTPFYAESGGQQGDRGLLIGEHGTFRVDDTQKSPSGVILHVGEILSGALQSGDCVTAYVDCERRDNLRRNHTATHLLNQALRETTDSAVKQAGSMVAAEYLRFDFNYFEALKPEQLKEIECRVNAEILKNLPAETIEMPITDVQRDDSIQAIFNDKYGDTVRVVSIGDYSKELCGGTHVQRTGDIGLFRIVSESSVASGIRRIEAVTGTAALTWTAQEHELLTNLSHRLSVKPTDLPDRIQALTDQLRTAEKQLKEARMQAAVQGIEALLEKVEALSLTDKVDNMPLLAATTGEVPMDALRELMDRLRNKLTSGVIILGSHAEGKACFMCSVSDDLISKGIHAGKLIGEVAKLAGGGGGGRPDKAQAGGKDGSKVAEAIQAVPDLLRNMHNGSNQP